VLLPGQPPFPLGDPLRSRSELIWNLMFTTPGPAFSTAATTSLRRKEGSAALAWGTPHTSHGRMVPTQKDRARNRSGAIAKGLPRRESGVEPPHSKG